MSPLMTVTELWGDWLTEFVDWYLYASGYADLSLPETGPGGGRARNPLQSGSVMFAGGTDPLHLGGHFAGADSTHLNGELTRLWCEQRALGDSRAEIVVPTFRGWYRALTEYGARLPALRGGRSWRIDVCIATIGYIGEFRRSRASGRWFAGRHQAHALGIDR